MRSSERLLGIVSFTTLLCVVLLTGIPKTYGECDFGWKPGDVLPGLNGIVRAVTTWDPDGILGPEPELLVVGGAFTIAGDIEGVTAGTGLTGGGTSGTVTVNVIGGTGITANANDIA